jgi:hypothetical protein
MRRLAARGVPHRDSQLRSVVVLVLLWDGRAVKFGGCCRTVVRDSLLWRWPECTHTMKVLICSSVSPGNSIVACSASINNL